MKDAASCDNPRLGAHTLRPAGLRMGEPGRRCLLYTSPLCMFGLRGARGASDELTRLLAEEKEENTDEDALKVKEDWGDLDEEAW